MRQQPNHRTHHLQSIDIYTQRHETVPVDWENFLRIVLYCISPILYPFIICVSVLSLFLIQKNAQSWRAPTVGDRTKATILQSERLSLLWTLGHV